MNKKRKIGGAVALTLAIVMILGSSMAYFTDRASTSANGAAGTVDIGLNADIELTDADGKDILNPGDGRKVNFTIPNLGNKSVDVRETIKLTSSVPMTNTETQAEFELYKTEDVEEVTGQGWRPKAGRTPLAVRTVSDNKKTISYEIPIVVLDGSHSTALNNYETEPEANGMDTQEERYTLIFRQDSGNEFQDADVKLEKLVEARQHRNTGSWTSVVAETYQFQNGDENPVVPPAVTPAPEPTPEPQEPELGDYLKTGPDVGPIVQDKFAAAKHLVFTDVKAPAGTETTDLAFDENSDVVGWLDNDTLYISSQSAGHKVIAQPNSSEMFYAMENLETADLTNLDVSPATDISAMFMACQKLKSVDTTGWDTSSVTEFYGVFAMDSAITELPTVSAWNTDSATDFACLFYYCENLESIDVSEWNTSGVTDFNSMFIGCSSLASLDLHTWDISSGYDFRAMLSEMSNVQVIDLEGWNFDQDARTHTLFMNDSSLTTIYADDWRTKHEWMYRQNLFSGCVRLPNYDANSISGDKAYVGEGGYFTAKP